MSSEKITATVWLCVSSEWYTEVRPWRSRMFQRQDLAVVADQGDSRVSHLLAEGKVLRFADSVGDRAQSVRRASFKSREALFSGSEDRVRRGGPRVSHPSARLDHRVIGSAQIGGDQQQVVTA